MVLRTHIGVHKCQVVNIVKTPQSKRNKCSTRNHNDTAKQKETNLHISLKTVFHSTK